MKEPNETLLLTVTPRVAATVTDASATATIINDD